MPKADARNLATILPPPVELGSARRLDEVGPLTILEAMIEQRRASRPEFPAYIAPSEGDAPDAPASDAPESEVPESEASRNEKPPKTSEVFRKAR